MRNFITCIVLGLFFGVSGYTFYYAKGYSYLSSDPRACVNCHIMQGQYDSWQKSSHHASAVCVDCHMPSGFFAKYITKAENGYLHSKAFTFQDFREPIEIRPKSSRIANEACLRCHGDMAGHIFKEEVDNANQCTRCHRGVGH